MPVPHLLSAVLDEGLGRTPIRDQTRPTTGGPAGNARLTAWTGLVLLGLVLAQLVTLLDLGGLISWHIAIGAILVPIALLKTVSVGWRMIGYYAGVQRYRTAGPPPTLLRWLAPLVVLTTLGLLGSGLALVALGQRASHRTLIRPLGFGIDAVTVHQILFIAFAVVVGLHLLARAVPAVRLTSDRVTQSVAGRPLRGAVFVGTLAAAALTATLLLGAAGDWRHDSHGGGRPGQPASVVNR
jgi:hypothetical protein